MGGGAVIVKNYWFKLSNWVKEFTTTQQSKASAVFTVPRSRCGPCRPGWEPPPLSLWFPLSLLAAEQCSLCQVSQQTGPQHSFFYFVLYPLSPRDSDGVCGAGEAEISQCCCLSCLPSLMTGIYSNLERVRRQRDKNLTPIKPFLSARQQAETPILSLCC